MFKKYLQQPLAILWAAIILVRAVLDHLLLQTPDAGQWFDLTNAIFCVSAPVAEFGIFYRAYRAYSTFQLPEPAGKFGFSAKIVLPLFFFCLPYGLWLNRRSVVEMASVAPGERWIALAGLAAACGFNLVLSGAAFHSLLIAHFRAKQAT